MTRHSQIAQPVDDKVTTLCRADAMIRAREEQNISQESFARMLAITPSTLSGWECIRRPMPKSRAAEIEALLKITLPIPNTTLRYDPLIKAAHTLKRARKVHGHSVAACAQRMGVVESSVYNWDAGFRLSGGSGVKVTQYIRNAELKMEAMGINATLLPETKFGHRDNARAYFDCTGNNGKEWLQAWKKYVSAISKDKTRVVIDTDVLAQYAKNSELNTDDHTKTDNPKTDAGEWKNQLEDIIETIQDNSAWRAAPIYPHSGDPEPMKLEPSDKRLFTATPPEEEIPHQQTVQVIHRNSLMVDTTKILYTVTDDKLKLIADFAHQVNTNFKGTL